MDKKITFTQFKRLMTSQPYFVWHSPEIKEEQDGNDLEFNLPDFSDVAETTISEIQAKSFDILEKKFEEKIEKGSNSVYKIKSKTLEDKAKETLEAIKEKKADVILNPIFLYEYKGYAAIAQPKLYSVKEKALAFSKLSGSTKIKDILKMWFDTKIVEKNNIDVEDISLFIIETRDYKKGEVDFFKTSYINTTKGGRSLKGDAKWDLYEQNLLKSGNGSNKDGKVYESETIYKIVKDDKIRKFYFKNIDSYLQDIIDAEKVTQVDPVTENDVSIFEANKYWNYILEQSRNIFFGFSGNIIPKKIILENKAREIMRDSKLGKLFQENETVITDKELINKVLKELGTKVVWYDFEGFSLPFSPMDHVLPYQQIISQVSIIRTNNWKEVEKPLNIVIDPKYVSLDNFFKIIKAIYKPGHKFVVYNKGYENTKLLDMIHLMKEANYPKGAQALKMVNYIIDNTIDLAEYFAVTSRNIVPKIFIPELKGKSSIKLIEKYINEYKQDLEYKITPYKELDIQNGLMAMEEANNRAMGITGDKKWEEKTKELKKYCENDVRAMIMVGYLMKDLEKN